jgi:hypothetical protein
VHGIQQFALVVNSKKGELSFQVEQHRDIEDRDWDIVKNDPEQVCALAESQAMRTDGLIGSLLKGSVDK